MARSQFIYTIGAAGKLPAACFTVKHEAVSWLRRAPLDAEMLDLVEVRRYPDGRTKETGPELLGTGTEFLERERDNRDAR